jgi:uncharacterized protein YkwD
VPVVARRTIRTSAAVAATVSALATPATADASTTAAARLASATNDARADHRLGDYAVASDLNAVARRWAAHMAATGTLAHNPNLGRDVRNWRSVGENVGVGPTAARIQRAFMQSTSHRQNILSRTFVQVGIGTARDADGRLFVDVVFRRPA